MASYLLILLPLVGATGRDARAQRHQTIDQAQPPSCEWCGAPDAPAALTSTMRIGSPEEPGTRLVVSGVVYSADGRTPAPGVLVYAWQTNSAGVYPRHANATGNGRRHGYLRGWLRTDADGRYRIATIRPGIYPTRDEPAHIHMTVMVPGGREQWIDGLVFVGDPLLTPAYRERAEDRGGSGIVTVTRDASGVLHATRNVLLGRLP